MISSLAIPKAEIIWLLSVIDCNVDKLSEVEKKDVQHEDDFIIKFILIKIFARHKNRDQYAYYIKRWRWFLSNVMMTCWSKTSSTAWELFFCVYQGRKSYKKNHQGHFLEIQSIHDRTLKFLWIFFVWFNCYELSEID